MYHNPQRSDAPMASENFITVRFTKADEDIKTKYWSLPDGERSDTVRAALRLYLGMDKRITFPTPQERKEPTVTRPNVWKPKGVK